MSATWAKLVELDGTISKEMEVPGFPPVIKALELDDLPAAAYYSHLNTPDPVAIHHTVIEYHRDEFELISQIGRPCRYIATYRRVTPTQGAKEPRSK